MEGLISNTVQNLFSLVRGGHVRMYSSFYEIYGGKCYDLLNGKRKINILEDKKNNLVA